MGRLSPIIQPVTLSLEIPNDQSKIPFLRVRFLQINSEKSMQINIFSLVITI